MLVDPDQAPGSTEQDGTTLYFCSRGCRAEFLAEQGTPVGYHGVPTIEEVLQ